MRRFTILGAMGFVLVLAALRGANDYWAGGFLTFTPLLFGLATIGALCGRPERRPRRIGFVVLGGGYFALAFLGLSDANLGKLSTSRLLSHVHQRVVGQDTLALYLAYAGLGTSDQRGQLVYDVSGTLTTTARVGVAPGSSTWVYDLDFSPEVATPSSSFSWRAAMPGAVNYGAFSTVGHCLFALLAGTIGAFVARRAAASRARDSVEGVPPCDASRSWA
jgi:hypothetical protein